MKYNTSLHFGGVGELQDNKRPEGRKNFFYQYQLFLFKEVYIKWDDFKNVGSELSPSLKYYSKIFKIFILPRNLLYCKKINSQMLLFFWKCCKIYQFSKFFCWNFQNLANNYKIWYVIETLVFFGIFWDTLFANFNIFCNFWHFFSTFTSKIVVKVSLYYQNVDVLKI